MKASTSHCFKSYPRWLVSISQIIIIPSDHFVLREGIDELIVPEETLLGLEQQTLELESQHENSPEAQILQQKKLKMLHLVKDPSNFGKSYIALEDMTKEMKFPCLMDVKIGSQAYNPLKIER